MTHGRLLTNVQRYLCTDFCCKFYPEIDETMLHLLRDCAFAQVVLNAIKIPSVIPNFFQLDWFEFLRGCSWNSFKWHGKSVSFLYAGIFGSGMEK